MVILVGKFSIRSAADGCKRSLICTGRIQRLAQAIKPLGLLSAINASRNLQAVPGIVRGVSSGIRLHDGEGVAMAGLALMCTLLDTVDGLGTLITASLRLAGHATEGVLGVLGIPVIYALVTIGAASRSVKIHRSRQLLAELQQEVLQKYVDEPPADLAEFREVVSAFLQKRLGVTEQEMCDVIAKLSQMSVDVTAEQQAEQKEKLLSNLKEQKHAMLLRHADGKVVDGMEKLLGIVESEKTLDMDQVGRILDVLKDMHKATTRRTAIQVVGIIANVLTFIAMTLILLGAPPFVFLALLALSVMLRLVAMTYEDFFQYRGIDLSLDFLEDLPKITITEQ